MQMTTRRSTAALLALVLVAPCYALFEDQAGTYDWYKAYVGHVVGGAFHRTRPRVYLGTAQGVAGSLNLRDGSIAWRQKLDETSGVQSTLLLDGSGKEEQLFFTLTDGHLRAWDPSDGYLKWQADTGGSGNAAMAALPDEKIATFTSSQIKAFRLHSGAEVASWDVQNQPAGSIRHVQQSKDGATVAYSYVPGSSSISRHTVTGSTLDSQTLDSPQALSSLSASGPWGLAVLSQDGQSLCAFPATGSKAECSSISGWAAGVAPSTGQSQASWTLQVVGTQAGVLLASGNPGRPGVVLLEYLSDSGSFKVVQTYSSASAISSPITASAGEVFALVEARTTGGVVLQYATTASGTVVASDGSVKGSAAGMDKLAPGAVAPHVKGALLGTFQKRDGSDGYRVLLIWSDERIALLQQSTTVWSRDEGLSGVTAALFTDLPAAAAAGSPGGPPSFNDFLKLQILSAKIQFKLATSQETSEFTALRASLSDKNLATRDTRGFRRALVVATSSGKVAALHNGDGHVLWARPGQSAAAPTHLLPWRTFHDLTHAPLVATLAPSLGASGGTQLEVVNTYTGEITTQAALPYKVDKLISLGRVPDGEHAEQDLYLALTLPQDPSSGDLPSARLLPDSEAARSFFSTSYRSLYFWLNLSSGDTTHLQGYSFDASAARALSSPGGVATAVRSWSLSLDEPLLSVAARDPEEVVHSSVKVLGDRSMKIRYLSPNLLLLVTGQPAGKAVPADEREFVSATITLMDAVTGAVLHRQTAPGCRGPAVARLVENLAVVQLWDTASARFTVTSLEVYDASDRDFSVLDALFNPNATQPQSSFNIPPLEVLTSSFYARLPARDFSVTATRAGITSRQLLVLTPNDQVYALDLRLVDPRRPRRMKLTAEEAEERLIPYQDTLPVSGMAFTTYNKQVLGLRSVVTAPARLESTCLVFAYGIDLQYTRLAPAKGFDSLDDDFSYGLLVVALAGLTGASVFLHFFTKASLLKNKWQ